ncbi:MAG: HAMP domain-containing sensor histidine kinase [Gallionellaceae bacterium]
MKTKSLRFRVAVVFAVFAVALSILFSGSLYWISTRIGHHLMDEILGAELEDSIKRYAQNPLFTPPNTVSIKVFVRSARRPGVDIPAKIAILPPQAHNVEIGTIDYRVLIADHDDARFYLLFETENQHMQEADFLRILIILSTLLMVAAAMIGSWVAFGIVTPLTLLVKQIRGAGQGNLMVTPSKLIREDEVGELARAFDRYQQRMYQFIERERYFTADISHELRTPLAIISGALEVLEQDPTLTLKQRERLGRIRHAQQDMGALGEGLLLMAREIEPATVKILPDVGLIVQRCAVKHEYLIRERPITLEVKIIEEPELHADHVLFEVMVANLLCNALFNTLSGKVVLRLEAQQFTVHDTGVGMTKEVLARVFERNFKGAGSAGAGVGLSLVKRICDRFGWYISIESLDGAGTTVTVSFFTKLVVSNMQD